METLEAENFDEIEQTIEECCEWFLTKQKEDGHWAFELEADATIPSEYIFLNHFLGEINCELERNLASYLRSSQDKNHHGWPLYYGGDFNISVSVKAYFALKLAGEDQEAPHMLRACKAILDRGGAARTNVFTRIALALFGQLPWRAVPVMRPEALLLPKWAPFHIDKVSYWSRAVMVPLLILYALKPVARNPNGINILELFTVPPDQEKNYISNPTGHRFGQLFLAMDKVVRKFEPVFPKRAEQKGIERGIAFIKERLNGEHGLGAIFPAMSNSLMVLDSLGYSPDNVERRMVRRSIDQLIVEKGEKSYCQPCLSPVWDTGLGFHALLESGLGGDSKELEKTGDWLVDRQILDVKGDWAVNLPDLRPGGWAFQYKNDHYPDVDDTAVVVMALHRANPEKYKKSIERAVEWILGMQSVNGGWGAFDVNNEHYHLLHIPFADHGALLDPPTVDVSARCLGMLAQLNYSLTHEAVDRVIKFIKREQESDGSWFGRWGTNYIYGTWSVLCALNAIGEDVNQPYIQRAVDWLKKRQRPDGGWGEDCASYWEDHKEEVQMSTPSHTSWAVLGLMAGGSIDSIEVKKGINYLMGASREGGKWDEKYYNAVGFPKVFYLSYHGYSAYFPLWALARYVNLKRVNNKRPQFGI
ncbi:MAG: Squalene--hopene cyclase [Alphaproteobacteria bacterium MarineAlpha3_Bin5]|nr:squalene--hopene cyclase [Magnetovibrio sp.]PPR78002.1 MAG: Squalene--hopene cyclase [Alphaproteobacteria bacterium MarineAlpha3_Bin5]